MLSTLDIWQYVTSWSFQACASNSDTLCSLSKSQHKSMESIPLKIWFTAHIFKTAPDKKLKFNLDSHMCGDTYTFKVVVIRSKYRCPSLSVPHSICKSWQFTEGQIWLLEVTKSTPQALTADVMIKVRWSQTPGSTHLKAQHQNVQYTDKDRQSFETAEEQHWC